MRFYWGPDGRDGEVILNRGDVASFPTNVFRGFENVSDSEALMFVILGENDPGVITWTPKILKEAKDSGMVLLDDNSLIDLDKQNIPDGRTILDLDLLLSAGIDYKIRKNAKAYGEYKYKNANFGSSAFNGVVDYEFDLEESSFTFGFAYSF